MRSSVLILVLLLLLSLLLDVTLGLQLNFDDDEDEEPVIFNYNQYLQRPYSTRVDTKSKVETLGSVLKGHIQDLKMTANKQIDLIFLVDSSTSVGKNNFVEEIKFVKKLLSDFTVDVNHTRVSVITFSSRERVINHIDYLAEDQKDRHKCSLLEEDLKQIEYSGGGTYTLGAFLEAKKVLQNARESASKAIFLVTDGFSNGGNPRPAAQQLREDGVKIFTFGIQNGNVKELYDMASPPKNESTYILDSFEEFEALAKRALHEDLSSGRYVEQPGRKCNRLCVGRDCCDTMAKCTCGTHTGKYECLCPAGYYGNGLKGSCQPCPPGTYKPEQSPGDVFTCTKCPDENHVTEPGATTVEQCVCRKGYRIFKKNECAVLKCPELEVPKNGYFVNDNCKNVFNAACGLRCKPGYELRGSSLRICREDGTWSGSETECVMKTCPALMTPKNGNMICTTDDFSFNTVCRFTCDTGYKLVGSRKRTCLAIAFWTGINTRCREITCRPLPIVRDGSIYPPACTAGDVAFGTTCSVTCHPGYSLIGPHSKQCLPEGVWTPATELSQCIDTSAPFIMCPSSIEAETDLNENTATVSWQVPLAVDNSGYVPILTSIPAVMPPEKFPIGTTKVTYIAEDLNKNRADCHFYIIVKDKQVPTIDRCFSPLPIVSPEPYADVAWEEPIFSDNSGREVRIRRSHAPGLFPKGKTQVTYTAYDASGNNRTCVLKINVIPHPCEYPPVPLNGNRTCHEDSEGVVCVFRCKEGYDFAIQPAREYRCAFDNVWEPRDRMPVSDCSALEQSRDVIQPASFTFAGLIACQKRIELTRIEKDFEQKVTKRIDELCEEGVDCSVRDLETTCEQRDGSGLRVVLGRNRRSAAARRHRRQALTETVEDPEAIITFNYIIAGAAKKGTRADQTKLLSVIENIKATLTKDAKRGDLNLEAGGKALQLQDMIFDEQPVFECEQGSVVVDNACAKCPVGTFFNVVSRQCESCPVGTFQPVIGQLSCVYCPTNTSTPGLHATTEDDCKSLCLPGTFSYNGLEMCETCRRGFYLDKYGQTDCKMCPIGFTTVRRGSITERDCKERCREGYVSRTGLQPCWPCPSGTYQPKEGQSSCFKCPAGSDTFGTAATSRSQCEFELSDSPMAIQPQEIFGSQQEMVDFDGCFESPCFNNATCRSISVFEFECICVEGYTGVHCQEEIDECSASPCLHEGTCTDRLADYECACPEGYTGKKCETNINECESTPCTNGATCVDGVNGFTCSCLNGFEGTFCELNTDDCASEPCLNGGICRDGVASYTCECPRGISGDQCEINEDDCASGPCLNEATCTDAVGTYNCTCKPGFTGKRCDTDINECLSQPCSAKAKCEDLPGGYKCHCPSGTTGPDCKSEIDTNYQLDFPSTASITDYARVPITKDLSSVTACFWMKTDDTQNQGTPFSYATADGDNILTLTDYDGFVFYVNGEKVTTTVRANDGNWKHVCVMWSSNRGSWKVYIDGVPLDSGRNLASGQTIKGGGQFVVGQEQDSLGGGFSSPESFIGQLTQLNVWSRELSLEDIESLRLNCEKKMGDVISWADIAGNVQGSVTGSPVEFCRDCPKPEDVENGRVDYDGLGAGSVARYTCDRGFTLAGRRQRLCLVTSEWEGQSPSCARVQCGYPGQIEHGWIEGQRFTFDNRIRYFCDRGYELVGSATRYCGEFGFWEPDAPTCELIKCRIPALSENTILTNPKPDDAFAPGEEAFFACTAGNNFYTAHTSVYCQRDGTWDRSIPTCDPQASCGLPPAIDNGNFPNPDGRQEFDVGYVAQYECQFGFNFSVNSLNKHGRISCLPTGEWEANLPECVVVTCERPAEIDHGSYESSGLEFLSQVRYSCNKGYELTHNEVLECFETGEWSKAPPECIPVRCNRPDDILHGSFEGDEFTYKQTIRYKCNLGYRLVGNEARECLENSSWSGAVPACKPVSCGKPDPIEHGSIIGRDYTLNNVIRYTCDPGYQLVGSEERLCRETGSWQNGAPVCERVECDTPSGVENGFFTETSFFYKDNVTYICEKGFFLEGSATLTCMANRQWSDPAPECVPIQCNSPPNIDHGRYLNPANLEKFDIGSHVLYRCDAGYEISRNSLNPRGEIECLETGQWESNLPVCLIVNCPQPETIQYGNAVVSSVDLEYGSFVRYICNEGYELVGDQRLDCEADGLWSGDAPVCRSIECSPPQFILNGRIDFKDLRLGSVIRYMCNEGYELVGLEVRRCLANLTYSGQEPLCQPVSCGQPENVTNGHVIYEDTNFQATATYSCNTGYILVGDRTRVCTKDKAWSGKAPVCEIVQCDKPSRVISNGRMIGEVYMFGATISYVCDPGYYIDGPTVNRTCLASGQWDAPIPVCIAVECPRLTVQNGFTSGFQTEFGTVLSISCRPGYRLEGATEKTCQEDGTWSGAETRCVRYACRRLEAPANGQVLAQSNTATYACFEGYVLNGPKIRECQANDTWSLRAPTCDPVLCKDITREGFTNGVMRYDQLTYGSTITFICDAGYNLIGDRVLECQSDGSWNGNMPVCEKKLCFPPFKSAHSNIIGTDFSFNATIEYQCDEGFRIVGGTSQRRCQADGSWSGSTPNCEFIICPRPEPNRNVIVQGTDYTYGGKLEYLCNEGYQLDGPSVRNCTGTGNWSGVEPRCIRNECPRPGPLTNGRYSATGYGQGSQITYECYEGYEIIGFAFRLCLANFEWTGSDPYCQKVKCPEPPSLQNGFYQRGEYHYGDFVQYQCDAGYEIVGEARRRCLSIGQWGDADATCVKISCGPPPVPRYAEYNLPGSAGEGTFGDTAVLSCDEGYIGRGVNIQRCQADGSWTESNFQCDIVTCSSFPTIKYARVTTTGDQYKSEAEIQCDEGYTLVGKARSRCGPNGDWDFDNEPYCEEIGCPELPMLSNGVKTQTGSGVGAVVTYTCDEGYRLHNSERRVCEKGGLWSGSDPYCTLVICDTPPVVENAVPFSSSTQYLYKSQARYVCKTGYEISTGNRTLICSQKGKWVGTIPTCSLVRCGEPTPVQNSKVTVVSYYYKGEAQYLCYLGYRVKGTSTIRCNENGKWSGTTPTCVPIDCGDPPDVPNAVINDPGDHTFESTVSYICDVGFRLVGQQVTTCLATGVWSGKPPVCEPISCGPPPDIANSIYQGSDFFFKSQVTYSCLSGYELTGNPTLTCAYDGSWSGTRPECLLQTCGPPPVFQHSTTMSTGSNIGSVATFLCNDGFYLSGAKSARCAANKVWQYEGDPPQCTRKDCGIPPDIKHGLGSFRTTTFESRVDYHCNTGYSLNGDSTMTCGENATWDGIIPTCEPVVCGPPPLGEHLTFKGNSFTFESMVIYSCDKGYRVQGSATSVCQADRMWSVQDPRCERVACKPLAVPENGITLNGSFKKDNHYGDTVELGCNDGYQMIGSNQLECLETGLWSKDLPRCEPLLAALRCISAAPVSNGRSMPVDIGVGKQAVVQCEEGYKPTGDMLSTCDMDQTWTEPEGVCTRVFCGKPRLRDFVNVVRISGASYFYGDQIKFQCRAGVLPARSPPVVTCRGDGEWDGNIACGVTCKRPCQNGGICLGLNRCKCPGGYGGPVCEHAICILPCLNGGKCTKPYFCTCPAGYAGVRCQKPICDKPCANGGRCLAPNRCQCRHNYSGAFCEVNKL